MPDISLHEWLFKGSEQCNVWYCVSDDTDELTSFIQKDNVCPVPIRMPKNGSRNHSKRRYGRKGGVEHLFTIRASWGRMTE